MSHKNNLLQYSLSASVFLLMNDDVSGQIIYTDIEPDSTLELGVIETDDYFIREIPIDLNMDGKLDFSFVVYSHDSGGGGGSSSYFTIDVKLYQPELNAVMNYWYQNRYGAAVIDESRIINEDFSWNTDKQVHLLRYSSGSTSGASSYGIIFENLNGYWIDEYDQFLGLRFYDLNGEIHYGWIRLTIAWDGYFERYLQIKDFAYEALPNTEIRTPCIDGCPEPDGTIDIISDGDNIYMEVQEFEAGDTFTIFDITGKIVFQTGLTSYHYVYFSNLTPGVYFVTVKQKNHKKTVKVMLLR